MTSDEKIIDELLYQITVEATKISALSSDKISKMNTIFMNSEYSKASHLIGYYSTLRIKQICKGVKKSVALSNLTIYYTWKNIKNAQKNNKFDVSAPTWNDNLNYQMDHILI